MYSVCRRMMILSIILLIVPLRSGAQESDYQPPLRAGIAPGKTLRLSLSETIALMLDNNIDIQLENNRIKRNRQALLAAEGVYDYILGANAGYLRSTQPSISALQGDPRAYLFESSNHNVSLSRALANGGIITAEFNNSRLSTNNRFFIFEPVYSSRLSLTYRQPLMKNFRINENQHTIRSLKERLNLADLHFRKRLIELVAQTTTSYYELAFALADERVKAQSVALAAEQVRRSQAQAQAGMITSMEVSEAEAEKEKRKEEALMAQQAITEAENRLKTIIIRDPVSDLWNYQIIPGEDVSFTPETFNIDSAISIALDNRPDVKELESLGKLNKLDIEFLKNQLKPQLDLVATFTSEGIAGSADRPNFFNIRPKRDLVGGYGTALSNIFLFRTYQVGINFSFPVRNQTARAKFTEAVLAAEHLDLEKQKLIHTITVEVRNAVQVLQMNIQRVEAARQAIKATEKRLDAEQVRFQMGLSTTYFVLKSQETLAAARSRELRAITDYLKARAELQQTLGNNLP